MYKNKKIAVVVPAYNEEILIESVIASMADYIDKIYVVDDASTDNTQQIICDLASQNRKVVLIRHRVNMGVGAAIASGYRRALEDNIDISVVMAGDHQMDGEYLPNLLAPIIQEKADYAKGNRLSKLTDRKGMSNWRFFGNWVLTVLTKVASGYWKIRDPQNGYAAITRQALEKINLDRLHPQYGYCNDLLVKLGVAGCMVSDVSIPARYGKEKSKLKYGIFITKVSPLLLKCFLWRLRMKYLK
ncbi:glycosyltransferase family 2 protein [Candidatus Pacearchaeota archaeon]|nr:glycosyltransferase family 2 protein [Candidatus Pacearchaeota archaeon]